MARKVIAYFLLSLGILSALFFKGNVAGVVPYTRYFFVLANIVWITGLVLLFTTRSRKQIIEQQSLKQLIEYFKNNGESMVINLSDCMILENNYTYEHEARPLFEDIAFKDLERFIPDDDNVVIDKASNMKLDKITQSILVYEKEINGVRQRFVSHIIDKDKATLMFLLDAQKQTTLHYDKNNPAKCYFDLSFLNDE